MLVGLAMGLGVFININTSKNVEPVQAAIDYSACETAHNANNKSNLKTALYNVVKNGNPGSYSGLWTSYLTVYKKSNGYLKDYYSNTSTFTSDNQDNGSGGTTEGDKYNREHTIPKSWWGGSTSNQGADIFIVVPADKLVNNKRSDNCLGMVGSATFSSNNNYSKLGTSTSSWNFFGSPVFEPNDEVKGDLARIVFYSVIKYDVSSWTTGNGSYVFSGNTSASSNFGLTANAIKLFSYWNNLDKPDDWERTVNSRGNDVQGNPNPFIDHPEYANTLWGDVSGYTTYSTSGASLSVSPSSGSITVGNTLNLTATASGGSGNVTWSITSGSSYVSLNTTTGNSVTVTGVAAGSATITASATISGNTYSAICSVTVTSGGSQSGDAEGSISASSGSFSGWTASGTGSAYSDGSIKFDSSGDNVYCTTIFTGDVSANMETLTVTINGKMNGDPNSSNAYRVEALDSSGNVLASQTKTGASIFTTSYSDVVFELNSNLAGCTGIKITYVTKGAGNLGIKSASWVATYSSSSTPPEITSISAIVSKTYYVGETISSSDITVKDNNNNVVSSFTFENDGYQFKYSDASSGGALTNKTFTNAIFGSEKTCSLTVQVQRKARVAPSAGSYSVSYSDLPTAYDTSSNVRTASSGLKFIAYNLAHYSNNKKMQFKGSGGYLQTTEALNLSTLTINNRESNTLTVSGSTNGSSFTVISGSNDVYNLSGYSFVKIARTSSGAAYCTDILITTSGSDTAVSLSNYIMYEDTNNQCNTKLGTAIGYLSGMSSSERSTFSSSNDYVISTARTRLEAWATSKGKTINYSNGSLSSFNELVSFTSHENNNAIIMLVILSIAGVSAIGACIYTNNKKKSSN